MSNCPKPEEKPVNSLLAMALTVPVMVAGAAASIVMGVGGMVAWAFMTAFSSGKES